MNVIELSQDEVADVSGGGYLWTAITDIGWFGVTAAVSMSVATIIPAVPKEIVFNENIINVPYLRYVVGALEYSRKSFVASFSVPERRKIAFKFFIGACALQALIGFVGVG
jgi:hypothetical protein